MSGSTGSSSGPSTDDIRDLDLAKAANEHGCCKSVWKVTYRMVAVSIACFGLTIAAMDFTYRGIQLWDDTEKFFKDSSATGGFGASAASMVACLALLLADSVNLFAIIDPSHKYFLALDHICCKREKVCCCSLTVTFLIYWIVSFTLVMLSIVYLTICVGPTFYFLTVPLFLIFVIVLPIFGSNMGKKKRIARRKLNEYRLAIAKEDDISTLSRTCLVLMLTFTMIGVPSGFYEMVRGFDVMQGVCDQIGDGDANELDMLDALRVTVGGILLWSASIDVMAAIRLDNLRENFIWVLSSTLGSILIIFYLANVINFREDTTNGYAFLVVLILPLGTFFYYIRHKIAECCGR